MLQKMNIVSQRMQEPQQFNQVFLQKKVEYVKGDSIEKKLVMFKSKEDFVQYY
jgi:hypothetical protein